MMHSVTSYTDFSKAFFTFETPVGFALRTQMEFHEQTTYIRPGLLQLPRKPQIINSIRCRYIVTNFIQSEKQMWKQKDTYFRMLSAIFIKLNII